MQKDAEGLLHLSSPWCATHAGLVSHLRANICESESESASESESEGASESESGSGSGSEGDSDPPVACLPAPAGSHAPAVRPSANKTSMFLQTRLCVSWVERLF